MNNVPQEVVDYLDHHYLAMIAFTSFMSWFCTIWSDRRNQKKFHAVIDKINELLSTPKSEKGD